VKLWSAKQPAEQLWPQRLGTLGVAYTMYRAALLVVPRNLIWLKFQDDSEMALFKIPKSDFRLPEDVFGSQKISKSAAEEASVDEEGWYSLIPKFSYLLLNRIVWTFHCFLLRYSQSENSLVTLTGIVSCFLCTFSFKSRSKVFTC